MDTENKLVVTEEEIVEMDTYASGDVIIDDAPQDQNTEDDDEEEPELKMPSEEAMAKEDDSPPTPEAVNIEYVPSESILNINKELKNIYDELSKDKDKALKMEINENTRFTYLYFVSSESSVDCEEQLNSLKRTKDKVLARSDKRDGKRVGVGKPYIPSPDGDGEVSSDVFVNMLNQATHHTRVVPLYNSGFNITIKGPTNSQINTFINSVNEAEEYFGRYAGFATYNIADIVVKRAIFSLLKELIIDSNLQGWRKNGMKRLFRHISYWDFKAIVCAVTSLLYPEGLEYKTACSSCKEYVHDFGKLDLIKAIHADFSLLPDEAFKMISAINVPKTPADLKKYNKLITPDKTFTSKSIEGIPAINFKMRIPYLDEWLVHAEKYLDSLISSVKVASSEAVREAFLARYTKMLAPWVESVNFTNADGRLIESSDQVSVDAALDRIQAMGDTQLVNEVQEFIYDANMVKICLGVPMCPQCGNNIAEDDLSYVPVDPISAFFRQSVVRL